jgi:hypothetical protein
MPEFYRGRSRNVIVGDVFHVGRLRALDLNRALGEDGSDRTNRSKHWRQYGPDDAHGQWKFSNDVGVLLDDDASNIAFPDQTLDRVEQLVSSHFEGLFETVGHE